MVQEGHSVLAHITDFLPYFYIAVPRGLMKEDLPGFIGYLNVSSKAAVLVLALTVTP